MNTLWQRRSRGERNGAPVEMRFVDMFMAALGALVFMAMLLSFLIRYIPTDKAPPAPPPEPDAFKPLPLEFTTATLPPATAGEPYEVALAYRGGSGLIIWELAAGGDEMPGGITFDSAQGTFRGKPEKEGLARIVVRLTDRKSGRAEVRSFELRTLKGTTGTKVWEKILGAIVLVAVGIMAVVKLLEVKRCRAVIGIAHAALHAGRSEIVLGKPPHLFHIGLPDGIPPLRQQADAARVIAMLLVLVWLVIASWLIWRIWFQKG